MTDRPDTPRPAGDVPCTPEPTPEQILRDRFAADLASARRARRSGDAATAWNRLEEAHVLSQRFPVLHVRSHIAMLGLAVRTTDLREIAGQLVRIVVAAPASVAGRFPTGNDGRARTPLRQAMPLDDEIRSLLERVDQRRRPRPGRTRTSTIVGRSGPG